MNVRKKSSLVLLSGGLDSTVNVYCALKNTKVKLALTFNYGQKAAKKEIECSKKICAQLGIAWKSVALPFLADISGSSLTRGDKKIPSGSQVKIKDFKTSQKSAKSVWVPNRNGVFLNVAGAYADSMNIDLIIPGFNKEEAQTFPDNSFKYLKKVNDSFLFSTRNHARIHCYTIGLNKTQIVKLGESLEVNWDLIWPCYLGRAKWCGRCESCQRAESAFLNNQVFGFRRSL